MIKRILKINDKAQILLKLTLKEMKAAPWMGMDETPIRVNDKKDEDRRKKTRKGYMWVMRSGGARPIIVFRYHPSREAALPRQVLNGYRGTLLTDEWRAYDFIDRGPEANTAWRDIIHAGCWVHVRRKFVAVATAVGQDKLKKDSLTAKVLRLIKKMYRLEDEATKQRVSDEQRLQLRHEQVRPLVMQIRTEIEGSMKEGTPVATLKKAINYTLRNWARLTLFLDDPSLPPDNNHVENAIRPFVIGRKNWLFAGSPEGATANARLYTLAETAKANGLNPYEYFQHLFEELPKVSSMADYRALLPLASQSPD